MVSTTNNQATDIMQTKRSLLEIENLTISFDPAGKQAAVKRAGLTINAGETLALVGESGSGKTLLSRAIVGLLPGEAHIVSGDIRFNGELVLGDNIDTRSQLCGRAVNFIFQEPLSSLNPSLKIGLQLTETLKFHKKMSDRECRKKALAALTKLRIQQPEHLLGCYPHELSGGMLQRVMIAAALMMEPDLIVADEPTTALDNIVCEEVLGLMKVAANEAGCAVLFISHDLSAVAALADRISVMKTGSVVEQGTTDDILQRAQHAYTRALLAASPQPRQYQSSGDLKQAQATPLVEVKSLCVNFNSKKRALNQVSLRIYSGETLVIIGESGSGKSTLGRVFGGLQQPSAGDIFVNGIKQSNDHFRKSCNTQFIFQDPFSSLDPRMRIKDIVGEGLLFNRQWTKAQRNSMILRALEDVALDDDYLHRFPHQLSGGQRQRVSIARAIVTRPDFIVADEPVSALDLTIQQQILTLLKALKAKIGFACLFVSHDLGIVEHLADRVGVLYQGRLVEIGPCSSVFNRPEHPYTQRLIGSTPRLKCIGGTAYELIRPKFCDDPRVTEKAQ